MEYDASRLEKVAEGPEGLAVPAQVEVVVGNGLRLGGIEHWGLIEAARKCLSAAPKRPYPT